MKKIFTMPYFLLGTVILFGLGIRLYNLNYNSPFLDEAIYAVIGKKVFGGTWQQDSPFSWVGGMPLFYPTLSGLFYNIGGIVGSRLLNVLLGTASIFLIFLFTYRLNFFDNKSKNISSGIVAALFFAIAPIPLWLSRLAIYDMFSYTLLMISVVLLQNALVKNKIIFYFAASFILFLSFLAKYTVFIFFPIIGIFLFIYAFLRKDHRIKIILASISFLILLTSYIAMFYEELRGFFTENVSSDNATAIDLAREFLTYTNIWYLIAIIGLITLLARKKYTALILFLISFLPLVANIISQNSSTIVQNTIFTVTLLLPLGGSAVIWFTEKSKKIGYTLLLIISFFILTISLQTVWNLEHAWPNANNTTSFLNQNAQGDDILLAELGDVAFLPLYEKVSAENLYGPYYLEYDGLEGEAAYEKAFADGFFTTIQLDGTTLNMTPAMKISLQENYEEIYRDGIYTIHTRK